MQTKWQVDQMTSLPNDKFTKWQVDQITSWLNVKLTKWPRTKKVNLALDTAILKEKTPN